MPELPLGSVLDDLADVTSVLAFALAFLTLFAVLAVLDRVR